MEKTSKENLNIEQETKIESQSNNSISQDSPKKPKKVINLIL